MKQIFLEKALERIPYLLSLQDRNPLSPSYGSFDREYWHYKKTDCPYSSVQGAAFPLAILYKNKLPINPYYKNNKIRDWIIASLIFLDKIQNKNGSFDEYYPNEQSYIGTSLTMYPASEAFLLMKEELSSEQENTILKILKKSVLFLSKNIEKKVINQEAMAALVIYTINQIFNENEFQQAVEKKIHFVLESQTQEGWFPEYEGCDVGYLSYTIDFLATYYKKSGDEKVLEPIKKAINFISFCLHPNGTAGGEYTARNTEYLVPHGFELISNTYPLANRILKFIEESLEEMDVTSLDRLDNRYLPLYIHQYLLTYLSSKNEKRIEFLPFEKKDFSKYFPNAGILAKKYKNFYIIIGVKKGGVIRIYNCNNKKIFFINNGYFGTINRKVTCSAHLNNNIDVIIKDNEYEIKSFFFPISWNESNKWKHMILRIILLGGVFSKPIRNIIKIILITKKNKTEIKFFRKFRFENNKLKIFDKIESKKSISLFSIDKFSFQYMPSAKFFQKQELEGDGLTYIGKNKEFELKNEIILK